MESQAQKGKVAAWQYAEARFPNVPDYCFGEGVEKARLSFAKREAENEFDTAIECYLMYPSCDPETEHGKAGLEWAQKNLTPYGGLNTGIGIIDSSHEHAVSMLDRLGVDERDYPAFGESARETVRDSYERTLETLVACFEAIKQHGSPELLQSLRDRLLEVNHNA